MTNFKAIATITWKFESDDPPNECLEFAKKKLEEILDCNPHGREFDGFSVQVDLARMKAKKKLIHIAEFVPEEVFPYITEEETKRSYLVDETEYSVRMNSQRYHVFRNNPACVCCGIIGTKMILDINPGDQSPHFNLYAEENGRLVLMTKDHITPKSRGGRDELSNYQSMCCTCNNLKGAHDLAMEDILELRRLWDNPNKLPRKELRDLINKRRDEMSAISDGKDKDERRIGTGSDSKSESNESVSVEIKEENSAETRSTCCSHANDS